MFQEWMLLLLLLASIFSQPLSIHWHLGALGLQKRWCLKQITHWVKMIFFRIHSNTLFTLWTFSASSLSKSTCVWHTHLYLILKLSSSGKLDGCLLLQRSQFNITLLWSCPFIRKLWLWYGTNSRKYIFFGTIELSIFCGYGLLQWCFFFLYLLTAVVVTAAWRGNNCLVLSTASLCLGGIRDLVLLHVEESAVLHWIVCSIANWFFCLLISIIKSSVKITGFILGEHCHFLSM